jgi:lysophospholipase L1-like esterase
MYVKYKITVFAGIVCFLAVNFALTDHPGYLDNMKKEKQLTWLALGDSYTIGEAVQEHERFAAQVIGMLKADGFDFSEPRYIATTGWTTKDLLNAISQQTVPAPYDIVSLLIGVNDQYQHLDTAGYRARFTECLEAAIRFAGNNRHHVFVLSIPDYSVTPFASDRDTGQIAREIDEFNAINKAITLSYEISYVEITALSREAKEDTSLIATDGLHPSGKEYAKWATLLATEIKKVVPP